MYHHMGFDMFHNPGPYTRTLKCYSVIMMGGKERHDVDKGGKIILPPSALDHLTRLHIEFPMLFKLTNKSKSRWTHCGVLEFVAEEGRCYLPFWMMKNLYIVEGDMLQVEYVNLSIAKFAKFQPQSVDFLEITNPKAVLENALRNFACLTKGDVVSINYNDKDYELCILETKPGDAVSIIECDMDVDFAPPVGYEEPTRVRKDSTKSGYSTSKAAQMKEKSVQPVHPGYRLDGKPTKNMDIPTTSQRQGGGAAGGAAISADGMASSFQASSYSSSTFSSSFKEPPAPVKRGVPNYEYKVGQLTFHHDFDEEEEMMTDPVPENVNKGGGQKLKHIGMKTS